MNPCEEYLQLIKAKKALDAWVEKQYPPGKRLRWKYGSLAGRYCTVTRTHIDTEDTITDGYMRIWVLVKTERKDKKGFLYQHDRLHRSYHNVDDFDDPAVIVDALLEL